MVAYEIMHSLKNRRLGCHGSFALKLDMRKEYDRVEWWFIATIMLKIGFCECLVNWVMRLVW